MSGEDELERGYRRLLALYPAGHRLALYPAGHRRVHEQEILGVLMTGARAGQRRPGLAESADLIWGALRIRLRLGRYSAAGQGWGDALAVVSIVLPVFFLFYSASAALAIVSESPPMPKALAGYAATQLLARAALAALVLLGPRRIAALAAGALLVWYVATVAGAPNWSYLGPQVVVVILCLVLEIMALLASPGPRQGLRVMTWKHHALVIGAAAAMGAGAWGTPQLWEAIVTTLTVITIAAMALASPLSRRVLALLATPLYYWAVGFVVPPSLITRPGFAESGWEGSLRVTLTCLPVMALLCLAMAVLLRSARHPRRPPAS